MAVLPKPHMPGEWHGGFGDCCIAAIIPEGNGTCSMKRIAWQRFRHKDLVALYVQAGSLCVVKNAVVMFLKRVRRTFAPDL